MAYVSLFLPHQYVVGRTSKRWNYGNTLCPSFCESPQRPEPFVDEMEEEENTEEETTAAEEEEKETL